MANTTKKKSNRGRPKGSKNKKKTTKKTIEPKEPKIETPKTIKPKEEKKINHKERIPKFQSIVNKIKKADNKINCNISFIERPKFIAGKKTKMKECVFNLLLERQLNDMRGKFPVTMVCNKEIPAELDDKEIEQTIMAGYKTLVGFLSYYVTVKEIEDEKRKK